MWRKDKFQKGDDYDGGPISLWGNSRSGRWGATHATRWSHHLTTKEINVGVALIWCQSFILKNGRKPNTIMRSRATYNKGPIDYYREAIGLNISCCKIQTICYKIHTMCYRIVPRGVKEPNPSNNFLKTIEFQIRLEGMGQYLIFITSYKHKFVNFCKYPPLNIL